MPFSSMYIILDHKYTRILAPDEMGSYSKSRLNLGREPSKRRMKICGALGNHWNETSARHI